MRFIGGAHPDNAYAQRFRHEIAAAEQDGYARFLGAKSADEMIECMDRASALVHTPIAETFGLVVAESLSRDLKVFGLSVGGLRDIVEGVDGSVLVGEQDWQALETAVETWIRAGHPPPGPAAQLMRQRYHPDSIARHHIEIYREVLGVRA
jgi:glycosyltransferase involved in cell wall biosynthesis